MRANRCFAPTTSVISIPAMKTLPVTTETKRIRMAETSD
jgi:hypothetical protein